MDTTVSPWYLSPARTVSMIRCALGWSTLTRLRSQVGTEHLEGPATTTAAGDLLPTDCDGEIDWTLFTFTHGFRQPRTALGAAMVCLGPLAAGSVMTQNTSCSGF